MTRSCRVFAAALAFGGGFVVLAGLPSAAYGDWGKPLTFPISADAATRTLVDADGQKVVLVGDAAWSLMVQLNRAEVQQYLDDRRSRGFNTVLVNLIEHKFAAQPPANAYGRVPFTVAGDFSTINPAYFDDAAYVVEQALQRSMLVLLAPMYLGYEGGDQGWYQELKANGTDKALAYGRYVGTRFGSYPNIVWVQGGDMPPSDVLPQIEAVVSGIKEGSAALHTAHGLRTQSSLDGYDRPWVGINSIYTGCSDAQSKARAEWLRGRAMPNLHIEGVYENEGANDGCLIGQMYYAVLSGARGHVFGNSPIWFFGTVGAGWPAALPSRGAHFMEYAAALFRSREGGTLVPDTGDTIVVTGGGTTGTSDYAAAARTGSGLSVLVYVPTGGVARTLQINTAQVRPQFVAWWYDTQSGASQRIGDFTASGNASFTTPAGAGPWVLVLDDVSLGSTPGAPPVTKFYTLPPCRVADTRETAGPALAAGSVRDFPAAGVCSIPATATAIAINATVTGAGDGGYLRLFPKGGAIPGASTLNFVASKTRANNAIIPLGTNGQISVRTDMLSNPSASTHFVIDVTGYFQ